MSALAFTGSALWLAGRPWTVWPVGVVLAYSYQAGGGSAFDAIGPTVLWGMASFTCRLLSGATGGLWRRSILPANKALPAPQIAVLVVPPCPAEACPDLAQMREQLPEGLRGLLAPVEG